MSKNKIEKKYLAPNAITATNMLLGYLSIINALKGRYIGAVWFIIIAMICDGLDGKAARKLEAYSEFGKEFDSFCDAISFGLAPALFVYNVLSQPEFSRFHHTVTIVSFIYALCGVMRLVKFNVVTTASNEKEDFSGMPIPTAASMIVSYYLFSYTLFDKLIYVDVFQAITIIAAVLMVSTIKFKTPDKVFAFVPKKLRIPLVFISLATLQYSLFPITYFYVFVNLWDYLGNINSSK